MGLYERLLEERAEAERCQGGPLPRMRGLHSKVLVRLSANVPRVWPTYISDLAMMHRLVTRGAHSPGTGMQYMSLNKKYPKEHAELKAEQRGQGELVH